MSDYTHDDAMRDLEYSRLNDMGWKRDQAHNRLAAYIERLEARCYVPGEVETLLAHIERLEAENAELRQWKASFIRGRQLGKSIVAELNKEAVRHE